jgi:hypothetical protein
LNISFAGPLAVKQTKRQTKQTGENRKSLSRFRSLFKFFLCFTIFYSRKLTK